MKITFLDFLYKLMNLIPHSKYLSLEKNIFKLLLGLQKLRYIRKLFYHIQSNVTTGHKSSNF